MTLVEHAERNWPYFVNPTKTWLIVKEEHDICHSGESLTYLMSNVQDGARLDVRAEGFWGDRHQSAFFDIC